jgi:glucokinase
MAMDNRTKKTPYYVGVDVGGTKLLAAVVAESGAIQARQRTSTPRDGGPEKVVAAIEKLIEAVVADARLKPSEIAGIGIAIPGVVNPRRGHIVCTPNMNLSNVVIGPHLESRFRVPVALGNDCNLGALGEAWLGSARNTRSAVAILVGTGIGGGFVRKGKVWRGAREAAAEIGHMVVQIDGPVCGCGNRGCLEALASRTAIENQLRAAVAQGQETILTELLHGDLSIIRSSALKQALKAGDRLVTDVMRRAAEVLGYGCLTVRHLIDPEIIILGGGVVEACSNFVVPIVEGIVKNDKLPGARDGGHVLLSALGDDAVVLGAIALIRNAIGRSPFKRRYAVAPRYPSLARTKAGEIVVNGKIYNRDVCITAEGNIKKRKKGADPDGHAQAHTIDSKEFERVCQGGPEIVFVGLGEQGSASMTDEALRFLAYRQIQCKSLPTAQIVDAYNKCKQRKAALIHVMC